jgi:hypothetical protein
MDAAPGTAALVGAGLPAARRSDARSVRLNDRDVAGLLLCGDMRHQHLLYPFGTDFHPGPMYPDHETRIFERAMN